MKSVRLHGTGELKIHDEPVTAAGEQLVRIKVVGGCGSILHWFSEGEIGEAKMNQSLVLGHEFAGETEDGPCVAIDPAIPCGPYEFCEIGYPNLCDNMIYAGHGKHDGTLQKYASFPTRYLFPLPDSLSYADGAVPEPQTSAVFCVAERREGLKIIVEV
jgi:L-iditol 2-dehydrogenase